MDKLKKLILIAVLLQAVTPLVGQTHIYPAQDTNNTFTGQNNFNNTVVFGHTWSFGSSTISNQNIQLLFAGLTCSSGQTYSPFTNTCISTVPCTTTVGAIQYNNSGVMDCANPIYSPTLLAFSNLVQYSNPNPLGSTPSLPGSSYFGKVASLYISETYATPFTVNQGNNTLGIFNLHLSGGMNENQDGLALKPGIQAVNITHESHTPGSSNPLILNNYCYSTGDCFTLFAFNFCAGGTSANGDEGCESIDEWELQDTVDPEGTITAGGSTGSTSITVSFTQGSGHQADQRYLLDLKPANLITAGTITAMNSPGNTFTNITGTGTGWTVSNVNTTLGTNVVGPGTGPPGVQTVTPASMTNISVGSVLTIADPGNEQTVIVTATTGTTFTAYFNKPQLSTAIVASGGLSGKFIGFTVDNVSGSGYTGTLLFVYPIIRSTSATSADIWIAGAGTYTSYQGSWTASTYNTYTIYPGAEVLDVSNGGTTLSNVFTTMPNLVAWGSGDTVDEPMYPYITQSGGNNVLIVSGGGGNKIGRVYSFGGNFWQGSGGRVAAFLLVNNNTPDSFYDATKNRSVPYGITYQNGVWDDYIRGVRAPTTAAVYVGGFGLSNACGPFNFVESGVLAGQDFLGYNQCNGSWFQSFGYNAGQVKIGPTGNFSTPGEVSANLGEFGTAQNLILQSQFPSGTSAPWVSQGTLALASVTPNNATDPNGGMTAETVVAPAVMTGTDSSGQAQTVSGLTNGGFYTETMCFRSHDGLGELIEEGPVGDAVHSATITLNDLLWHCPSTYNGTGITYTSAAWSWVFEGGGANQGATIDVAFAQLEPTPYHAQYVATTSSAAFVQGIVGNNLYVSSLASCALIGANSVGKAICNGTAALASPPPIGSTTPNTGKFTTLTLGSDSSFSAGPRAVLPASTGPLTAITTNAQFGPIKVVQPGTIENIQGTAASFTCTGNPILTLEDCGTSAGTCASPTALGSVTLTAANTITNGSISSATLTAGHYLVWETTAGTCTALNASSSAEYRMN